MDFVSSIIEYLSAPIVLGTLELPFNWLILAAAILMCGVFYVIYRLLLLVTRKVLAQLKEKTQKNFERWIRLGLRLLYLFGVFAMVGWLFGARMFEFLGKLMGVLGEPIFSSGSTSISFFTLLLTIPVFYLASWAGRASRGFLRQSLFNRMRLDASRQFSIASLVRYGVMVVVVLIGLSILGIDLSAMAVIFGVLGIGIGFGLQNVVSNFFAGLVIILTRPIKEGDRILVNGYDSNVAHIRLLSTIINTVTDETIIIPNSQLINNSVHNYSYDSPRIIIINTVSVSYGTDLDKAVSVLESVGRDSPYRPPEGKQEVRVEEFEDSGIKMLLLSGISDVGQKFKARSWINLEIWRRFRDNGIQIPFPQVDVHIKEPGGVPLANRKPNE